MLAASMVDGELPFGDIVGLLRVGGTRLGKLLFGGAKAVEEGTNLTAHGATRIAGAAATRGGVLTMEGVNVTKSLGRAISQADGATVYLHEISPGKFNAVVEGDKGLITTMSNWSLKSINRIAKKYGWTL